MHRGEPLNLVRVPLLNGKPLKMPNFAGSREVFQSLLCENWPSTGPTLESSPIVSVCASSLPVIQRLWAHRRVSNSTFGSACGFMWCAETPKENARDAQAAARQTLRLRNIGLPESSFRAAASGPGQARGGRSIRLATKARGFEIVQGEDRRNARVD